MLLTSCLWKVLITAILNNLATDGLRLDVEWVNVAIADGWLPRTNIVASLRFEVESKRERTSVAGIGTSTLSGKATIKCVSDNRFCLQVDVCRINQKNDWAIEVDHVATTISAQLGERVVIGGVIKKESRRAIIVTLQAKGGTP